MRHRSTILAVAAFSVVGAVLGAVLVAQSRSRGTPIGEGESCPPGTTEIRPQLCLAPQIAPPSILDYRPKSTLVTAEHLVPRAKYPAIDFHGHPGQRIFSSDALESLGRDLDTIGVRVIIAADDLTGSELRRALAVVKASPTMRDRVRILAGVDLDDVGPGWAARAVKELDDEIAAGAVGVGEISKSFGLRIRKADGTRLRLDDPDLDPLWAECARLGIPVFIHTADPASFFQPLDITNERWLEMALFPYRRYPEGDYPRFDELIAERDDLFRKHPDVTFVAAHMGWEANDLVRLGKLLDQAPNVVTEVGAVLYDIGRQPHAAHDFFVKYQDRILFGKDAFEPIEYPYYWRVFETSDDYFDYYRNYHAFWKLYGIALPDPVLKKLYYANALRITKGIPQEGWSE